jgi:hypothetical protein
MADIDQRTGEVIDNYASAVQSVGIVFSTRLAEMIMLREFGAGLIELLGRLLTSRLMSTYITLMMAAIDIWEPRFRVRRIYLSGSVERVRLGAVGFSIEVDWRPNAHLGDTTVEGVRTFGLTFLDGAVIAR